MMTDTPSVAETETQVDDGDRSLWRLIVGSGTMATLCCLPSVVLVMFGLASVSTGAALSDQLYWGTGGWRWFRPSLYALTLILIAVGLVIHFRRRGICTLDEVKRQRRRVINTSLLVLIFSFTFFLVFNYVILEFLGLAVGLPWEDGAFWI